MYSCRELYRNALFGLRIRIHFYENIKFCMHMKRRIFIVVTIFCLFLSSPLSARQISDEAQAIYGNYQKNVYQICVINLATGKKSALGSGFLFSPEGYVATNYHVLSEAVHYPQRYRVECIRHDGEKGLLTILDVDVIHDLAITKIEGKNDSHLVLGNSSMGNGARIFSMGDPYDFGMVIVEGIYNGLMENALYRKILFSGSLNPGMSGGPALDHNGQVIGVNVSTAGNQISFLVPVEYLKTLYGKVLANDSKPIKRWTSHIEQQLVDNQNSFLEEIIFSVWDTLKIAEASVPGEFSDKFKCWGSSKEDKKYWLRTADSICSSEDTLFISSNLSTGKIIYTYRWVTSRDYNPIRFYNLLEEEFRLPYLYGNAGEEEVTNFECTADFVEINKRDFKATLCARNYKKYPKLSDINFGLVSVDRQNRALLVEVVALGVVRDKAIEFLRRFMKGIRWLK